MRSSAPRAFALFLLVLGGVRTLPAQTSHGFRSSGFCDQIKAIAADPSVSQAHWGFAVASLDGTVLCSLNPAQLFRPASNAKLFTASAALALLGPEKTFSTTVFAESAEPADPLAPSELQGDLRLVGDGDAFLSRRIVPYTRETSPIPQPADPLASMADAIVASGLRHITGSVIGDDSAWPSEPYAPDWSIDDAVWGYGAPVSALSVYDNKIQATVAPGARVGSAATALFDPPISFGAAAGDLIKLDLQVTTVAGKAPAALRVERLPGSPSLRVSGSVALAAAPYTDDLAIPDPALYTAHRLAFLLKARGVQIDGPSVAFHRPPSVSESFTHQLQQPLAKLALPPAPRGVSPCPNCRTVATHVSATLLEDVTITLKVSQNLHAELLLHHLGELFADDGSDAQGVRVVEQFACDAGVMAGDLVLFDGSGLSGHDLVTPRAVIQLLVYDARQSWFPAFKAALPVGGTDGSLAGRFLPPNSILRGRVFAKTGTLGESRALSGYLTAASGKPLVFSILVDNHPPSSATDRTAAEKMVELIAAAN